MINEDELNGDDDLYDGWMYSTSKSFKFKKKESKFWLKTDVF